MKPILETDDSEFIGGIEVGLKNQCEGGQVIMTASGNNLIISGFA